MLRPVFADTSGRRDKLQIYADIIKVSVQPVKITKILRMANVQYNTFRDCIDKLCAAGLLEKIPILKRSRSKHDLRTSYVFKATDRGLRWCQMVEEVYKTLDEVHEIRAPRLRDVEPLQELTSLQKGSIVRVIKEV